VCYFETTNFVRSVLVQERGGTNSGKRSDAPVYSHKKYYSDESLLLGFCFVCYYRI